MSSISIRNPIDITIARNFLRKQIAGPAWTPNLRARAAAVMTTFAEFILNSRSDGTLSTSVLKQPGMNGVRLRCIVKAPQDCQLLIEEAHKRLTQITDELQETLQGEFIVIDAMIWTQRGPHHE